MPDSPRETPLSPHDIPAVSMPTPGLILRERPHTAKITLRGKATDRDVLAAAGKALDLVPPTEVGATQARDDLTVFCLSPDEWLVEAAPGRDRDLAAALTDALRGTASAVIDVTDNTTCFVLSGPRVRDVLAKGTPFDLHATAFPAYRVGQTLLARVDVTLRFAETWPEGDVFHLFMRRSFAAYLWQWLIDAGLEHGVDAA